MLQTLWSMSLTMATFSLLIMTGLLITRALNNYLGQKRKAERERLMVLLLGGRDGLSANSTRPLKKRVKLITDLSVELIQLVRGNDRERFVATATSMDVPEHLWHRLDSGSPRIRLAAAEALAQFDDDKSMERLRLALEDPNPAVRIAAAVALAALGRPPAAVELVYKLGIGTRENSLLAVSLFRDVAEQRPNELKALLVDENIPAGAKAAVIESLSASADYTLVPMIVSLAGEEEDPRLLTRYLQVLGTFGHPDSEPAVRRGLMRPHWEVRAAAAEAAGRIGLVTLGPNLKKLLGDPEWWVRFRAGEALARFGAKGVDHLREVASSENELARSAASKTISERCLG